MLMLLYRLARKAAAHSAVKKKLWAHRANVVCLLSLLLLLQMSEERIIFWYGHEEAKWPLP
jgi:hypothetical protein